jgi:hypothetical protein
MSNSAEIQETPSSPVSPAFSPTKPAHIEDADTPDTQTEPESNVVYETPNLDGVKKRLFSSQDEDEAEDEEDEDEEEKEDAVTVMEERAQQMIEDITEEIDGESARNNYDIIYNAEENSFCITGPGFTLNMAESLLQRLSSTPEFIRRHPTQLTRALLNISRFLEASYELRDVSVQLENFASAEMAADQPFQFGSARARKLRKTSDAPK